MTQEIHRELGSHDARLDALEKDIHSIRNDMTRIFERIDDINKTLSEAKGGWKTLIAVGGFSAVITGVVMKLLSVLPPSIK